MKVDLAKITFASLLNLKGKMGDSARDFTSLQESWASVTIRI
jgi:hypothetical protein